MRSLNEIAAKYNKRVDNWTRLKTTALLLANYPNGIKTIEGKFGGTIAIEEVAIEFEKWCKRDPLTKANRVYFIRAINTEKFKIGISADPRKRLKTMQIGSPVKLVLSRDIECTDAALVEKKIHACFDKYKVHGEWFSLPIQQALEIFDFHFQGH